VCFLPRIAKHASDPFGSASHEVSFSLQRLQVVLRYPRQPALGRSRFDVGSAGGTAGGRSPASRCRPCGFSPCVISCAARAAENHGPHRFSRVMRRGLSFARRSATRMPNLHTTGPDLLCAVLRRCAFDPATLLGFMHPSQCSSLAGPGVCESLWRLCVRDSPPFIPTCRYPMQSAPLIFTVAGAHILNSFRASFWKSEPTAN